MRSFNIFLNSPEQRARVGLYCGFFFNILYAVFKLTTGIIYKSVWFGAVALYYILLCTIKFLLIRTDLRLKNLMNKKSVRIKALLSYKRCGKLLMLLNLSMAVIVIIIIKYDKVAEYSGYLIWIFGGYTLYRVITAIIDARRIGQIDDPLLSASKSLNMSVAMMSMFSLQTALLDRFCSDAELRRTLNSIVGFAVCIIVIIVAVAMIVRANRKMNSE